MLQALAIVPHTSVWNHLRTGGGGGAGMSEAAGQGCSWTLPSLHDSPPFPLSLIPSPSSRQHLLMMAAVGLTKVSQKNTNFEHNEVLVFLLFTLHNSKHVIIFRVYPFFQANEQTVNARSQFCSRLFCTTSSVLILFRQALGKSGNCLMKVIY